MSKQLNYLFIVMILSLSFFCTIQNREIRAWRYQEEYVKHITFLAEENYRKSYEVSLRTNLCLWVSAKIEENRWGIYADFDLNQESLGGGE